MTDENTPDAVADKVETATPEPEKVTEAVVPEPEPDNDIVPDEIPPWGQELQATVNEIMEKIAPVVENPVTENAPEPEIPGDGEPVADENPVPIPWTHKSLSWFGTKG